MKNSPPFGSNTKISILLPEPENTQQSTNDYWKEQNYFITDFLENTKTFSMYGLNKKLEQSFDESRAEEKFGANFDKVNIGFG